MLGEKRGYDACEEYDLHNTGLDCPWPAAP